MNARTDRREGSSDGPRRSRSRPIALRLTIDGRLVAHGSADTASERCELYLFHEYGHWSLLTVTSGADGGPERSRAGSASVHLESHGSFDDVLAAVHAGRTIVRWEALLGACADAGRPLSPRRPAD